MSKWNPETIHAALEPIVAELGRFPKREELSARGLGGLSTAMGKHGGVAEWRTRFVVAPVADAVVVEVVETVEVAPASEVSNKALAMGAADWLDALPGRVARLAERWDLTLGPVFSSGTEALVIDAGDAVLKIGL